MRSGFSHVDNVIPIIKTIAWLLLSRLQGNKPHRNSPEPSSGTYTLRNPPEPSETFRNQPVGTFRNLRIHRNPPKSSGTFRNLPLEPTPFYTGTFQNLVEPASGTYTSILRNPPEPGTCLRNLRQHTPELSGTSSGTCSCDLRRHTPELIWAEDPISLRCWGISYGGIPNSSSLMPCLTTWAHSCSAVVLPMRTMLSPKGVQKQSHGCSCQGCKATNHS